MRIPFTSMDSKISLFSKFCRTITLKTNERCNPYIIWKIGQSLGEVRTQAWAWPSGVLTRKKSSETQSCASVRPPLHYMWWMTRVTHAKCISLHSRAAWARQLVLLVMHWVFHALLITMVFITWETQNSYFHANFPLWFWALFGSWNEREWIFEWMKFN